MGLKNVQENVKNVRDNVRQRVEELKAKKHFVMNRVILLLIGLGLVLEGVFILENQGHVVLHPTFVVIARAVITIILTFVITAAIVRLTEGLFTRLLGKGVEIEQRLFFTKIYAFTLYLSAAAIVLYQLGVTATNMTLILGLITTGLAFAVREVLISYLVWFMLLTKKPFRIGDCIRVGEDMGKVLHIGTFYVIIDCDEELDSEILRIPNKVFLEKNVQNFGQEGIFLDKLKIPFKGMPEDIEARMQQAQQMLKEHVKEHGYVHLDVQNEWTYLILQYPVKYERREEVKTKLLVKLGPRTREETLKTKP